MKIMQTSEDIDLGDISSLITPEFTSNSQIRRTRIFLESLKGTKKTSLHHKGFGLDLGRFSEAAHKIEEQTGVISDEEGSGKEESPLYQSVPDLTDLDSGYLTPKMAEDTPVVLLCTNCSNPISTCKCLDGFFTQTFEESLSTPGSSVIGGDSIPIIPKESTGISKLHDLISGQKNKKGEDLSGPGQALLKNHSHNNNKQPKGRNLLNAPIKSLKSKKKTPNLIVSESLTKDPYIHKVTTQTQSLPGTSYKKPTMSKPQSVRINNVDIDTLKKEMEKDLNLSQEIQATTGYTPGCYEEMMLNQGYIPAKQALRIELWASKIWERSVETDKQIQGLDEKLTVILNKIGSLDKQKSQQEKEDVLPLQRPKKPPINKTQEILATGELSGDLAADLLLLTDDNIPEWKKNAIRKKKGIAQIPLSHPTAKTSSASSSKSSIGSRAVGKHQYGKSLEEDIHHIDTLLTTSSSIHIPRSQIRHCLSRWASIVPDLREAYDENMLTGATIEDMKVTFGSACKVIEDYYNQESD